MTNRLEAVEHARMNAGALVEDEGSQTTRTAGPNSRTAQTEQLDPHDTSLKNQQAIVLAALREGAQTTVELRHSFGVMHPAARVQKLREMGYRIDVVRVAGVTPDGVRHKAVARYVLAPCDDSFDEALP